MIHLPSLVLHHKPAFAFFRLGSLAQRPALSILRLLRRFGNSTIQVSGRSAILYSGRRLTFAFDMLMIPPDFILMFTIQ